MGERRAAKGGSGSGALSPVQLCVAGILLCVCSINPPPGEGSACLVGQGAQRAGSGQASQAPRGRDREEQFPHSPSERVAQTLMTSVEYSGGSLRAF
jgi:hypothetical protein